MRDTKGGNPFFPVENLAVLLAFAFLLAVFYREVLFDHQSFVFVDSSRFFYPFWKWGAGVWEKGILPLWNPDAQFGIPYWADPQMDCVYPPLRSLYAFLSPTNAFNSLIILHHGWALLGFWAFARAKGLSHPASFGGSVAFGFSLHVICSSWTPPALFAISWIPWVFWAAGRIAGKRKYGLPLLSLFWTLQLSAGYPVLSYLTGLALFLDLSAAIVASSPDSRWEKLASIRPFLVSAAVAVGANLIWGLPFWELFQLSNFGKGVEHSQALGWKDLATSLTPFYQGHPLRPDYHGPHYWIGTYFAGLPTVVLLLWGFGKKGFPKSSAFLWLLIFTLCLGETLGLGGWLKQVLPGYSLVIRSGFWLPLLLFWTAGLAATSADRILGDPRGNGGEVGNSRASFFFWEGLVAVVYGASFYLARPPCPMSFWLSGLLVLASALPWFSYRPLRWLLLGGALVFSLGPEAESVLITLDSKYYDEPPKLLSAMTAPGRLFFSPRLMGETHILKGKDVEDAYETAKRRLYPNWPLAYQREEAQVYNTLVTPLPGKWALDALRYSTAHSRAVLDFLNVRYLLGKNDFKDFKRTYLEEAQMEVAENPTPLPKWFSVSKAYPATNPQADFSRADQLHLDYGKECFVSGADKSGDYAKRRISEAARAPQRVELEAEGTGKALLVSSESAYPGWKARVEGVERPLEVVNHVFRGVVLGDSEKHLVLSYEPFSFRLGLFLSLLACGFWVGCWFREACR